MKPTLPMRKTALLLPLLLILAASQCKKEDSDCHKTIVITNLSNEPVIYSTILYDGSNSSDCLLSKRSTLATGESFEENLRVCWEDELTVRKFKFYIVDTAGFNDDGFYTCDSIEFKNAVLRKYELNLENLKATNFTVYYP
ncbi:MAG: hypothetical protein RIC95_14405 [Vicingaceae bacterium]